MKVYVLIQTPEEEEREQVVRVYRNKSVADEECQRLNDIETRRNNCYNCPVFGNIEIGSAEGVAEVKEYCEVFKPTENSNTGKSAYPCANYAGGYCMDYFVKEVELV